MKEDKYNIPIKVNKKELLKEHLQWVFLLIQSNDSLLKDNTVQQYIKLINELNK